MASTMFVDMSMLLRKFCDHRHQEGAVLDLMRKYQMKSVSELKALILLQQQLVADLARKNEVPGSRIARNKLLGLLHELELAEAA